MNPFSNKCRSPIEKANNQNSNLESLEGLRGLELIDEYRLPDTGPTYMLIERNNMNEDS